MQWRTRPPRCGSKSEMMRPWSCSCGGHSTTSSSRRQCAMPSGSRGEERGDMEKLMYLTWLGEESTRSDVSDVMLGRVGEELLALDPVALTIDVWDPKSDIPAPVPTPQGETPLHGVISLWVDSIEQREPLERVLEAATVRLAAYSVVESLYRDYGGN